MELVEGQRLAFGQESLRIFLGHFEGKKKRPGVARPLAVAFVVASERGSEQCVDWGWWELPQNDPPGMPNVARNPSWRWRSQHFAMPGR